jgi:hypothetical protein
MENLFLVDLHVAEALSCNVGLIDALLKLSQDIKEEESRQRASRCLVLIAGKSNGRIRIISTDEPLTQWFNVVNDDSQAVRTNGYAFLTNISAQVEGQRRMVALNYIDFLIEKLSSETIPSLVAHSLNILLKLVEIPNGNGVGQAQRGGAIEVCVKLIQNSETEIKTGACALLGALSVNDFGKMKIIKDDAIPPLLRLISDPNRGIRYAASGVLMMISLDINGKYGIVDFGGVRLLIDSIAIGSSHIGFLLNVVKVFTNLACHPEGRQLMKDGGALEELESIRKLHTTDELLLTSIDTACSAINWTP